MKNHILVDLIVEILSKKFHVPDRLIRFNLRKYV